MTKNLLFLFAIVCVLAACDFEKEIDLDLPEYQNKLVVECYLEPGKPYRLTLTESVSYFTEPRTPTVDNALVIISYNGVNDTLKFTPLLDETTNNFYNYVSETIVPEDYVGFFSLYVKDTKGREVTSQTKIPDPPTINSVEFKYNEDSLAFALTKFNDINTSATNYYRYLVTHDSLIGGEVTDYIFNDRVNSEEIEVSFRYKLKKDDLIIVSVFHLNEDYYRYLESIRLAMDANGNPFGQPASIKSNVQGGIGIFTGISYDRVKLFVN